MKPFLPYRPEQAHLMRESVLTYRYSPKGSTVNSRRFRTYGHGPRVIIPAPEEPTVSSSPHLHRSWLSIPAGAAGAYFLTGNPVGRDL